MGKNVQIPMDLFLLLVRYHYLEDNDPQLLPGIRKALESKLESMIKHELYSVYSNKQLSDKEREAARKQYLDRIGLRDSFRWPEGWNPEPPSNISS